MKKIILYFWLPLKWFWKLLSIGATVVTSLLIISCITFILTAILYRPGITVPENSVLVLAPKGDIVEQRSSIDPFTQTVKNLAGLPVKKELALQDIIDGVYTAADDSRINMLLIDPGRMGRVSLNQVRAIGDAIAYFKESGKKVLAAADSYTPTQYYLASWADEIFLHPMGSARVKGFGIFRLYLKDFLEKLAVDFHVFRVGTFKSAVEPLLRNNMSNEARDANRQWLNAMWEVYSTDIAKSRKMTPEHFNTVVDSYPSLLKATGGNHSRTALDNGLIDGVKNRHELTAYLTELAGPSLDNRSFNKIQFDNYLQTVTPTYMQHNDSAANVGIITAVGNIMYGEGTVSQIGSDTLIKQIRQARFDQRIKALVLRISTGGGSAFASELIRQELLALQKSGKPVVVSMGSVAASGGYWVAADADLIVASPLTLTGSIGIFGVIPTIDKTLEKIGVHGDGVGTGTTALFGNPASPMTIAEKAYHQVSVENGYQKFLQIVADGRDMPLTKVKQLAQGKVWDGKAAKNLGLVDRLGTLETAVAEAAKMAGLPEENAMYINSGPDGIKGLLQQIDGAFLSAVKILLPRFPAADIARQYSGELSILEGISADPQGIYAHSLLPSSIIAF